MLTSVMAARKKSHSLPCKFHSCQFFVWPALIRGSTLADNLPNTTDTDMAMTTNEHLMATTYRPAKCV